jgi:thiol-disulfide isomerase/thioredoxin
MQELPKQYHVPEIYGDFWFNSDPIPLQALRGSAILLNFWDYTCSSALRTLPYIHEWHKAYKDAGLVVIGVHTPMFPFARDPVLVRKAVERLNIQYPMVMDNEYLIWTAFRNRVWPTKYLVDKDGFIRIIHDGEGSYQNFEYSIRSLLSDAGYRAYLPAMTELHREMDRPGAVCYRVTPEIFAGFQRGSLGNVEGSTLESVSEFTDPGYYLEGRLYLQGNWLHARDYVKLSESDGREGSVSIAYKAKEVNVVVKPEGEKKFQVFVKQDENFLTEENRGEDIHIDGEGKSYFLVNEAKLYNIVKNAEYTESKLTLSCRSNGFALYSFSFVSSVVKEQVNSN